MAAANLQAFRDQYATLNEQQRTAVDTIEGPVIVLAGPGTGKTQVLAMRVANILLQTHMDPYNILCLTFTEAAATAMRRRLVSIIGSAAYGVRIQTFHSFCNDLIQDNRAEFPFKRDLEVLSDVERVQLFEQLIDQLPPGSSLKPFGNSRLYVSDVMGSVQVLKQENISPQQFATLLDATKQFAQNATPQLSEFFALKPSDRTDAACAAIHEAVLAAIATDQRGGSALKNHLEQLYQHLQDELARAEDKRVAQSIRTNYKNELKGWFDRLSRHQPHQRELLALYTQYQEHLEERGRYDYEDMISFVIGALSRNDTLRAYYQENLQYILVDEYQDTNGSQNEVLRLLGAGVDRPNIFVVGDDNQSIYRFQGASIENLNQFYEWHKDSVRIIPLVSNYRSPQLLLDAADQVIRQNEQANVVYLPEGRQALVAALKKEHVPIALNIFGHEAAEDYWVAQQVKKLKEEGVPGGEIAVLYRYHADATGLAALLSALGIPFRIDGGEDIFTERRIQQLMTLLTYLDDTAREDLLAAILHYDFLGLPQLDVLKAIHQAGRTHTSIMHVLSNDEALTQAGVREPEYLTKLLERLAQWRQRAVTESLPNFLAIVVEESSLLGAIIADPERVLLLNYLNTFFSQVKKLVREQPDATLATVLTHFATLKEHNLKVQSEVMGGGTESVRLMTAHRAKGLEFDHVFVIRLTDGHWGNVRTRGRLALPPGVAGGGRLQRTSNDDERRLFYVAMTRAKQRLYISYATQGSSGREQMPSLFVQEVPPEFVETITHQEDSDHLVERVHLTLQRAAARPDDQHIRDWLATVLERYTLSVTHLNTYLECPRLFYYRYLLRVPQRRSKHLSLGTAVHGALHDWFNDLNADKSQSIEYALERFRYYLGHEILTDSERQECLALGEQDIRNYLEHYQGTFVTPVLLEYNFRTHRVQLDGIRLTGLIDKIEIVDPQNKIVNVVDYKTGNPDNRSAELGPTGTYRRQLVFYKLLGDLSPKFPYTITTGDIDFLEPSERRKKFVRRHYDLKDADVAALKEMIKQAWQEITALEFLNPENPKFCGQCEYCTAVLH